MDGHRKHELGIRIYPQAIAVIAVILFLPVIACGALALGAGHGFILFSMGILALAVILVLAWRMEALAGE